MAERTRKLQEPLRGTKRRVDPESVVIVDHGLRWAQNILVEVAGNHGRKIPKEAQDHLGAALSSLNAASMALAPEEEEAPADERA